MIKNITKIISNAGLTMLVLAFAFTTVEPAVSFGAPVQSQFTISQTTNSEVSFVTLASNVVMSPTLGGITGGTANGLTQVAVLSNNSTGYNMTIQASSTGAMQGTASSTNFIPVYSTTTPDYNFVTPANSARFGYTVNASTTSDVTALFKSNGSNLCGVGGSTSGGGIHCWIGATSTAVQIINRGTATAGTGATTTLYFQVGIAANPLPAIPNDTYVSTSTLTATANP